MAILTHNVNINVYNVGDEMLQYTNISPHGEVGQDQGSPEDHHELPP